MDRICGASLLGAAGQARSARDAAGEVIWRFAWTAPLARGLIHGDPNPGNYLVLGGAPARVAFLDYGCTASLDEHDRRAEVALWQSLLHHDLFCATERFRQALHGRGMIPSPHVFQLEPYQRWERLVTAPFTVQAPFQFTAAYARDLIDATNRLAYPGYLRLPAPLPLLWRQRLGVTAILGMLDATIAAAEPLRALSTRGH